MKHLATLMAAVCLMGACGSANARQLTPAQALQAARQQLTATAPAMTAASTHATAIPELTLRSAQGEPTVYVFGSADGYLVTAADDAVPTILLGYSDGSAFDPANVPPQMQWWLEQLSAQVAYAAANAGSLPQLAPYRASRTAITPLVKTLWDQDAPYNNLCPQLTSSSGTTERAVTGCVATAMAQTVKVFNYPTVGLGSNSYSFNYLSSSYTASFNFAATPFSWADMTDTYASDAEGAAATAVATLMKACGVSVNMSYGLSSTGGSGASSFKASQALVTYFNYDLGVHMLQRENFNSTDWNDLVYAELAAGRPVLYGGQSNEGGHAFVCDGYSTDDYFHINWGWGGMSNGYFLLTVLDPPSQGIGGSNSGFNMDQTAIVGICPPGTPGAKGAVVPQMIMAGNFAPESTTYSRNSSTDIVFGDNENTGYYNYSIQAIPVILGLKLTASNGSVSYVESYIQTSSLDPRSGWRVLGVEASDMPIGTYEVTPAFKSGGQWYDIYTTLGAVRSVQATVTSSTVAFTVPTEGEGITVTACTFDTPVYIGQPAQFHVAIEATEDYYGTIIPVLVQGTSIYATGAKKGISLNAGQSTVIDWVSTFSSSSLTAGTYDLVFIDTNNMMLSPRFSVNVLAEQSTDPTVSITAVAFDGAAGAGTRTSPFVIDPNSLKCTMTLTGTNGYWADNVRGMFFDSTTGTSISSFGGQFVGLTQGQSRQIALEGAADSLVGGQTYLFVPWGSTNGQLTTTIYYVRATTTGIEGVTTETDAEAPRYYTLQGIEVSQPQPGQVYIKVQGAKTTKTLIR